MPFDVSKYSSNKNTDYPKNFEYKEIKYSIKNFIQVFIYSFVVILFLLIIFYALYGGQIEITTTLCLVSFIVFLLIFHFLTFTFFESESNNANKTNKEIFQKMNNNLYITQNYAAEISQINENLLNNIKTQFKYSANFLADLKTIEYEISEKYLQQKKQPALTEALRINELKKRTKEAEIKERLMRYEYDKLFSLFPELENYLDYYDTNKDKTISEVKETYDYVKSWVSKKEYEELDENKRNQLALDRYIKSPQKSKWDVGRDYEMFIGYEYTKQGYQVTYNGISEKLADMGRDLIAKKGKEIYVIQCKNWSKDKVIYEKHICQLFGTTWQYNIENNSKAIPVFITSTILSNTALQFAEHLRVQIVQNVEMQEFPRIKCNINKGEKIYHLPFDQQYDRTQIKNTGEFYAWTVEEATKKGFRRAKKYFYNN